MECIRGKQIYALSTGELERVVSAYDEVFIDVGTGDGRYVVETAKPCPRRLVIGVDACRENLRATSRRTPTNALFVVANAPRFPNELSGLATSITINFPWGSLLRGLLADDSVMSSGLVALASEPASIEINVNGGALAEVGWTLDAGAQRIASNLERAGLVVARASALDATTLRRLPTTWAKRLAFGRDPRGICLTARVGIAQGVGWHLLFQERQGRQAQKITRSSCNCNYFLVY